jgi:hypothetical protein
LVVVLSHSNWIPPSNREGCSAESAWANPISRTGQPASARLMLAVRSRP